MFDEFDDDTIHSLHLNLSLIDFRTVDEPTDAKPVNYLNGNAL